MEEDRNDETIRALFDELGEAEGDRAPSFDRVWARAETQLTRSRSRARVARAALAVGALAVAVLLMLRTQGVDGPRNPGATGVQPLETAVAMTEWRSPTQSLLDFPGYDLLKSAPRLGAPLPEIANVAPLVEN